MPRPLPAHLSAVILGKVPGPDELLSLFLWFGAAAVAAVAGYCVVLAVRRWAQREERVPTFTFQDLREMRARGQISEQEFASMRDALLIQAGATAGEPSDSSSARPEKPSQPD